MVTNNLTLTAEASAALTQPAQNVQPAETGEASFSELLQNVSSTPKICAATEQTEDAAMTEEALLGTLGDILKDMLEIIKKYEGADARGEMLGILTKLVSGEKDDDKDNRAAELVMSVLANLVNNGAEPDGNAQLPVAEQSVICPVDFTAAAPVEMYGTAAETTAKSEIDTAQITVSADKSATAENILDRLLSFAEDKLGLTEARLTTASPTAEQLKQGFGYTYAKAAGTVGSAQTGELEQLIANLAEPQTGAVQSQTPKAPPEQSAGIEETDDTAAGTERRTQERQPTGGTVIPTETDGVFAADAHSVTQVIPKPAEVQLTEAIADRLMSEATAETEFTLELNPENLGRITVKLTTGSDGKIAVEITANNPETQKLLDARAEGVQQTMKNNGVELEKYQVVYSADEATFEQQSYNGSSKNPYLRQEQENDDENNSDVDFAEILSSM